MLVVAERQYPLEIIYKSRLQTTCISIQSIVAVGVMRDLEMDDDCDGIV
jgi:hypothetical protein